MHMQYVSVFFCMDSVASHRYSNIGFCPPANTSTLVYIFPICYYYFFPLFIKCFPFRYLFAFNILLQFFMIFFQLHCICFMILQHLEMFYFDPTLVQDLFFQHLILNLFEKMTILLLVLQNDVSFSYKDVRLYCYTDATSFAFLFFFICFCCFFLVVWRM